MSGVYIVEPGSQTRPMQRVRCKDEDKELQSLLESNLELLPGNQIDPDDPRCWMLIKREMPVPDPAVGTDRWSIDLLIVDQRATPTFVECKRFQDTGARREVVGQMLEYAANGCFYWNADTLRGLAEQTAGSQEQLLASLRKLDPQLTPDDFFRKVWENLREGQIRLVFFMEEAPQELKSIVDFLNKQMERAEVLLVEAKQYQDGQFRVVVPTLFGFTEEARMVKRQIDIEAGGPKRWNEDSFFQQAKEILASQHFEALRELIKGAETCGYDLKWGKGKKATCRIVHQISHERALMVIYSNGDGWFAYNTLGVSAEAQAYGDRFLKELAALGLVRDGIYPPFKLEDWANKSADLREALCRALESGEPA